MERIETPFIENRDKQKGKRHAPKGGIRRKILAIVAGVLLCAAVIAAAMYFLFPIKNVIIRGNRYLAEEYVRKIAGIEENQRYFFRFTGKIREQMKEDQLIRNVTITRGENLSYIIDVEENTIVGYQITGSNRDVTSTLILADGQIIPFSAEYMKNLALTPMFIDISDENCRDIAVQLGKLEFDVISRISEVSVVSFTYDENMIKLTMEDGYKVYSSINGLGYMKDYFDIVINKSDNSGSCILIMEEYSSAAILECREIEENYISHAE